MQFLTGAENRVHQCVAHDSRLFGTAWRRHVSHSKQLGQRVGSEQSAGQDAELRRWLRADAVQVLGVLRHGSLHGSDLGSDDIRRESHRCGASKVVERHHRKLHSGGELSLAVRAQPTREMRSGEGRDICRRGQGNQHDHCDCVTTAGVVVLNGSPAAALLEAGMCGRRCRFGVPARRSDDGCGERVL